MDESESRELFKLATKPMLAVLGLERWTISVVWGPFTRCLAGQDGGIPLGQCRVRPRYLAADLEIDHNEVDSKAELLRVLRHELIHIYHNELKTVHSQIWIGLSSTKFKMVDESFQDAKEAVVFRIEHLLDSLGQTPEVMAGMEV